MLKKLSLAAALLAVLLFLAVLIFRRVAGPTDGASLLPADTVFYASLTDLPRSMLRWQGTALAEIGRASAVKAFLEKPLSNWMSDPGTGEAGGILAGLKPTRLFFAVTGLSSNRVDAVVGFQFWGGKKDFDEAVARLRKELPPGGTTGESYAGDEIVSTSHGKFSLFSAAHGRWGFLATDGAILKSLLDRASGKSSDLPLAKSPDFQKSLKHMLPAPDFLFFLRPQKVVDVLLETGRSLGAEAIPGQISGLRATEAVAGSWKLDGRLQRDAIFLLRPGVRSAESLAHKALRFTAPDTVLYVDFLARFAGLSALLEKALPDRREAAAELAGLAVSAFGPEAAVVANWQTGQMTPSMVFALEVRDPAVAGESLKRFLSFFPETLVTDQAGIKLHSIPSMSNPLASPTLTLTRDFLIVGLDPAVVARAAGASGPTIDSQPAFGPALPAFQSSNEAFAFVDSKRLVELAYNALRPVILFGAQVMPGVAGMIDTSKLPQTDAIAGHLPPVIFSQQRIEEGVLIESSGPLAVSQIALGLAIGAAAGAPAPH
ncbi:MAG: hypothetical protein WCQ16_06440 [Verrucomicrobiae bacterium]